MQNISNRKVYYLAAALILLLCIIGGLVWKHAARPKPVVQDIPHVRTAVVEAGHAANSYSYSGEVRGRFESQLAFQVTGKIIKRNIDLGSSVESGNVLMVIDPKDLNQTANSSSAQVYSAQSQLRLAENNLKRYRELYEQGAISRAQYDQYIAAYDAAVATARQASAQYVQASNLVNYSQLCADAAGVVSAINAEVGQVVSVGQPVVTIVRDGEREVEINVPENRIQELRQANQIKITFWALPSVSVDGSIREIAPMADKVSRTYKVRITMIDPTPEIKLGMTASVEVGTVARQHATVFSIPLAAIYQTGQSPAVWVVADGVVALRPITVGNLGNGKVLVLEGLRSGDVIVTAGVHKLREGQKVNTAGDSL